MSRSRVSRSPRALALNALAALAFCFCWAAGCFELTRARAGHTIAWVYTFEWPFFAIMIAVMWWRSASDRDARVADRHPRAGDIPDDDPGLRAWRDYLAELEHDDTTTDRAPGSG